MAKLPENMSLITALCARYSLEELQAAIRNDVKVSLYYYPQGKTGPRKYYRGTPTTEDLTLIRTLLGAALGRTAPQTAICSGNVNSPRPDERGHIGDCKEGMERIQTYKWTSDHVTRKPIPPNSFVWRDIHTGWIYQSNPFTNEQAV